MSQTNDLRIGVIGFGARGNLVAPAHLPGKGSRVVAASETRPARQQLFREKYGEDAAIFEDYRALLDRKDIDAVFICSPDFLHEEQAIAAIEAGKAIYLEKPMAITIEGCDRILAAAARNKGKVYVGHNLRHLSVFVKMKELVDAGAIGQVKAGWCRHFVSAGGDFYFKDWHAERKYVNSLLLQKGAHDLDILHWLCGGHSVRAQGMGGLTVYNQVADRHPRGEYGDASTSRDRWPPLKQTGLNPDLDVEDLYMMNAALDNGAFITYQECHYTPDYWRNYTIIGTEGRMENFNDRPGECVIRVWNKRGGCNLFGDEQHFIPEATGTHGGADPLIVAEFVRYARDGGAIRISPLDARAAVAAGCAATTSIRENNRAVDIPPVDPKVAAYFK